MGTFLVILYAIGCILSFLGFCYVDKTKTLLPYILFYMGMIVFLVFLVLCILA